MRSTAAAQPDGPAAGSAGTAGALVNGVNTDVAWLSDGALADQLRVLWEQVCRAHAEFTRVLGVFDARGAASVDGAPSTASWLRGFLHVAPGQAADLVRSARHLPTLPTVAADHAAGRVSAAHVAVLARAADTIGAATVAAAEPVLVEAARRLDPTRLAVVTARLRHAVDPDGALDDVNEVHQRRRLHLSQTFDGAWVLDALLEPEGGAALRTALDAVLLPPAQNDDRTPAQRRADALVDLAQAQLRHGELPDVAGQRPHLTVTIDVASLAEVSPAQEVAAAASHPTPPPRVVGPLVPTPADHGASQATPLHQGVGLLDPPSLAGRACGAQFEWGGHAHAETARRIACDAGIARVVLDPAGQPLDVGRRTRLISPALRRALAVRDGGCRFPGCTRPPAWTDAHHIDHWAHGGPTALPNLVLLCRHHHRLVHEGRWAVTGNGSAVTFLRPDGIPLQPP